VVIRYFTEEDSLEISNIIRRCFKEINSKYYPKSVIKFMSDLYTPQSIIERATKEQFFVYVDSNQVLGSGSINIAEKYIGTVFINPDFHRKKIGKQIMARIEKYSLEKKVKEVYVDSSLNAIDFYKKLGYKKIKMIHDPNFGTSCRMKKKL
jgi:N-acetylglutamate synthase-like GNAT family acetyltransferase